MQAALRPNPTLSSSHEHEPGGMMITGVDVEWPLDLFRRPARVTAAQRMADVTSLSIRDRERLLASLVREQAGRVLAARRTLELINEALTTTRRMRDLLDRRVTEGGSTKLDANLAAVEALRLEADAALATGDLEAATIELKAVVGLEPDAPLVLSDSLEGLMASPMVPRMTPVAAIEARPDLREAIARIGLADARAEAGVGGTPGPTYQWSGGWTQKPLDVSAAWDSTTTAPQSRSRIPFTPLHSRSQSDAPVFEPESGPAGIGAGRTAGSRRAVRRAPAGGPRGNRRSDRA